jgi:23S rRNA (guanosine2251-2'-O)-methyltransferase
MDKRIVPGINSVIEALNVRPQKITYMWMREGDLRGDLHAIYLECQKRGIKVKKSSPQGLDKIVQSHQGVIAEVMDRPEWPDFRNQDATHIILAMDQIEDPHNVGSIIRSAWNMGVHGVIFTKERSAHLAPAAQKVACGGFEHVPYLEVSNLTAELKTMKELGFWVYGLSEKADKNITQMQFPKKVILVVGSESDGMRQSTLSGIDEAITIPQIDNSNSYNASVAAALAMYEVKRQWGSGVTH